MTTINSVVARSRIETEMGAQGAVKSAVADNWPRNAPFYFLRVNACAQTTRGRRTVNQRGGQQPTVYAGLRPDWPTERERERAHSVLNYWAISGVACAPISYDSVPAHRACAHGLMTLRA